MGTGYEALVAKVAARLLSTADNQIHTGALTERESEILAAAAIDAINDWIDEGNGRLMAALEAAEKEGPSAQAIENVRKARLWR